MRNYLLIGGSRGIGAAVANILSAQGDEFTVISRSDPGSIAGLNQHIPRDVILDDLSDIDVGKSIDGLVYLPGTINLKPFRSLKTSDFEEDFKVNVLGAVKVLKTFFPHLKKGHLPSVVMYSTVAVNQGMPFHSSVASAKGAVEGLVKSLAAEWAPTIRVNGIAPSLTDTDLASRLLDTQVKKENAEQRHPLRRVGEASDIAAMTCFLLSEKSAWVSGQIIGVDGGLSTLKV
nr:SDR family oxidoreductase [Saprospiraceae bacterium]